MIAIRCDSSFEIGTGHVTRCLKLAELLKSYQLEIHFFCKNLQGSVHQKILDSGFALTLLQPENDGSAEILKLKPSWLVVDHYQIDIDWESKFKDICQVFVIDDLKNRKHFCQVLLDQNFHENARALYKNLVPEETRFLLGPKFALIHPQKPKTKRWDHESKQILVFFGGADTSGETLKFIQSLEKKKTQHQFKIVITESHKQIDHLKKYPNGSHYEILISPKNWSGLLATSDFYFGSGGTVTWERMQVGLPGAVVAVADNQVEIAQALARNSFQLYLGISSNVNYSKALEELEDLLKDNERLAEMARKSQNLVRSFPALLIQEIFEPIGNSEFQMKVAQFKDARFLYDLRQDPVTQQMSISQKPFDWESHCQWLQRKLKEDYARLYIAYKNGQACGQLRIDPGGEISIAIAADFRGQGLAPQIIQTGIQLYQAEFQTNKPIIARVKPENPASLKSFQKAGFEIFHDSGLNSNDYISLRLKNDGNH